MHHTRSHFCRFVSDELKRRTKLVHMTYFDFCEALARITTLKPLPTRTHLVQCNAATVGKFYMQAMAGLHAGVKMCRKPRWQEDEVSEASNKEPLEILISLIIERLDTNGDGIVSRNDLKERVKRAAALLEQETK